MHVKVPDKIEASIKKGVSKYAKILDQAKKRDINESDTSNIVYDMLGEVLGYDKFLNVTTEYRIKGQYADYGIKIDSTVKAIIEVKAIGIKLNDQHISQAVFYGANEGINWVVLTNGRAWHLYNVSFVKPIETQLVCATDILDENIKPADKISYFYVISKDSVTKNLIDEFWKQESAFRTDNIVSILFDDGVQEKMRRDLKLLTGYTIAPKELKTKLETEVIREGLMIKPIKLPKATRKRAAAKKKAA